MSTTESVRPLWPALTATAVVTAVVLGPLLISGGIALRGDMVFTPDQPWKPAWLGLDGSVPRAVPMDALVSLFDEVLPGALLQRLLLVVAFVAGGTGIARLTRRFAAIGQVAAVVVYLWSPWVLERLAIGQWPTVLGYGLLPWLVLAAARARDRRPGGWPATMLLLVLAGVCGPSFGLIGALVAVVVIASAREPLPVLRALGLGALANLPWGLPALLGSGVHASKAQFGEFAARGESSLGTLASLLSMGGIWKSSIVPTERTHLVVVGVAALVALAFLAGFLYAGPVLGHMTAVAIAVAGGAALLLALVPAIGPVGRGLGALSTELPAVGLLRDSQRYLAPLGLVLALGAAALVDRVVRSARADRPDRTAQRAMAAVLVVAPVLLLPSMVWGLGGMVRPVHYPDDWDRVAARVSGDDATVVMPWTGSYRGYSWNNHRAVLDPAPRFLPGEVLIDDRIFLGDRVLPAEDPFLARVGDALDATDASGALRRLGVRWILVEKENGVRTADVPAGTVAYDGHWLRLVDLGPPSGDLRHWRSEPPPWIVILGDSAVLFATCVAIWKLGRGLFRTRR